MPLRANDISLQLCELADRAFTKEGWLFELKLDGFRMLAEKSDGHARLYFRRGSEATAQFPEVAAALARLPQRKLILDGELVIQNQHGKPVFEALLERSTLKAKRDIDAMAKRLPAVMFCFDLLALDGHDLRERPLVERKQLLKELLPADGRLRYHDHLETQGEALLDAVRAQHLEGIVAKRADSPYRGGRSSDWLKVPLLKVADFAVVGYARDDGALHLAVHDEHGYAYAGKVGSGYTPRKAKEVKALLEASKRRTPAFRGEPFDVEPDDVWVEPKLVVEVRYKDWPPLGCIRQGVFLRFRPDKGPEECPPPAAGLLPLPKAVKGAHKPLPPPQVKLSNPKKVFWPDEGITKQQLFDYYRAVSPWLLPYLKDRPLMLTRYPDGIAGKSFFQKSLPVSSPTWVRSIPVHNEEDDRDFEQIICDDLRTLEWVANLGTVPLHLPAARASTLDRPDWCVIDFDPKQAPFADVVTLARTLHELCDRAGLPNYVKTTGSSGLHVLIPLGRQCDHRASVQLAELLTMLIETKHRDISTRERMVKNRGKKVYLDAFQNGDGKLIASPLCLRPLPGAPVSMPITWSEVTRKLHPRQFTLRDAVARLEAKGDPMLEVLGAGVPLGPVIERLSRP